MFSSFFWKKLAARTGLARYLPSVKRMLGTDVAILHRLSDRALALPVAEMLDPAWFPDIDAPDSINLALGSPRCELPLGTVRNMNVQRPLSAWGLPELREQIAAKSPAPGETLITHGATGAFAAVIDTFITPGDKVVLFDPTSPIFRLGLQHRRARIRWVDTWMDNGHTRFDIEAFAATMRGSKLLVMADPCNPTGGTLAVEDLEQIAWWSKKHDVLIHLDESFQGHRHDHPATHLSQLPNSTGRLLCAGSVSKTFGMNHARVGWLTGPVSLLRPVAAVSAMAAPHVSPYCQQLALTALKTGTNAAAAMCDEFAGRRRFLLEALQGMGLPPAVAAAGYFFWVPVSHLGLTGREFARQLLVARRVLVNPGEPFGPSGEDHIRLSYATDEGRLREGIQRLAEFMEETRSHRPDPLPLVRDAEPVAITS